MSTGVNRVPTASISVDSDLARVADALRHQTVHIRGRWRGSGSGVIWHNDGLIITNAHVARESPMRIELADGGSLTAALVARDTRHDLAALRANADHLPTVQIGDPYRARAGEIVIAVGNPMDAYGAVTRGILHAAMRPGARWLEADISLAPGNSGGPLADVQGRVLGINSMIVNGVAFAVPVHVVERFVEEHRLLQRR